MSLNGLLTNAPALLIRMSTGKSGYSDFSKANKSVYGAPTACKQTVSGSISLPYSGYFSPFPHGTSSLSVLQEYLALSDGSDRFRQDFTCPALLRIPLEIIRTYVYGTITLYGSTFQLILLRGTSHVVVLQPQSCRNKIGLGCSGFARRYYRNHYYFLFLWVLRCFSSPG